jgi:hypothetical protein
VTFAGSLWRKGRTGKPFLRRRQCAKIRGSERRITRLAADAPQFFKGSSNPRNYFPRAGARLRNSLSTLSSTWSIVSGLVGSTGNSASTLLPSGETS